MPDLSYEGLHPGPVCGVDEAGRGPLAGPVCAAAVILREGCAPDGLNEETYVSGDVWRTTLINVVPAGA